MDHDAKIARGKGFFNKIYAKHSSTVLAALSRGHPDLGTFAIESLYGELLSEFSILNENSTSLVEMVACIATNAIPQAKGHVYGARNMGESTELIQQCISLISLLANIENVQVEFRKMDFLGKIGIKVPIQNGV
jgi:alkylhydroperoxidase/carboxymuconolactone decarboxylase family protein YurZ